MKMILAILLFFPQPILAITPGPTGYKPGLLRQYRQARILFMEAKKPEASEYFKKVIASGPGYTWDHQCIEFISKSHYYMARIEPSNKNIWVKKALSFNPGYQPDPRVFPPDVVAEYNKQKKILSSGHKPMLIGEVKNPQSTKPSRLTPGKLIDPKSVNSKPEPAPGWLKRNWGKVGIVGVVAAVLLKRQHHDEKKTETVFQPTFKDGFK